MSILLIIEGIGAKGIDPSYLSQKLETEVGSSLPKENGIVIARCGHHRQFLAAADSVIVFGECSAAPAEYKRFPVGSDISAVITAEWESMLQTTEEEEPGSELEQ